jgi:phosphatidylserine decarboxylase
MNPVTSIHSPRGKPHTLSRLRPRRIAGGVPRLLWVCWGGALVAGALPSGRGRAARLSALGASALTAAFFRDPDRHPRASQLVAAADGRVTAVDHRGDGRWRIATYMSLRDVHVNRAPGDGVVVSLEHRPGGHLPAFDKDSERNERLSWRLDTAHGELEIIQIAGALARRIVPYRATGDQVRRGERIGLIRFGSRLDVILPPGLTPAVAVGDRLRAGESRLAT